MSPLIRTELGSKAFPSFSDILWNLTDYINSRVPAGTLSTPNWAPGRLLKSCERSMPPLGLPRKTTSLCPKCNQEAAFDVLCEAKGQSDFADDPGLIEAEILEEAGRVLMRKVCRRHGPFEDVLCSDVNFFKRMESLYPGRDFICTEDEQVHNHGRLSIRYGARRVSCRQPYEPMQHEVHAVFHGC